MTTATEIREWLDQAKAENATHMIVVCDAFGHENYPIFVAEDQSVSELLSRYDGKNMQSVMECYNMSMDLQEQLKERRAYHP